MRFSALYESCSVLLSTLTRVLLIWLYFVMNRVLFCYFLALYEPVGVVCRRGSEVSCEIRGTSIISDWSILICFDTVLTRRSRPSGLGIDSQWPYCSLRYISCLGQMPSRFCGTLLCDSLAVVTCTRYVNILQSTWYCSHLFVFSTSCVPIHR